MLFDEEDKQMLKKMLTPVNTIFVLLNILIFVYADYIAAAQMSEKIYETGVLNWKSVLEQGQYYRLVTCMFLHFGVEHIFHNMLFLIMIGGYLERAMGSVLYAFFYLLAGVLSGVFSLIWDCAMQAEYVSAGASGAIFAVVGGLLCLVILHKGQYDGIGLTGMLVMIAGTISYGFRSVQVDNSAHIGGLISGFILALVFFLLRSKLQKNNV